MTDLAAITLAAWGLAILGAAGGALVVHVIDRLGR